MKNLSREEAILLGLLTVLGREVLRTKLVKMTYLLDNLSFEHTGQPLTDFTYHSDHYGPNAVGNAITQTLSQLSQRGLVHDTQKLTPYENYSNYYKVSDLVKASEIPLSDEDWSFIHAIVHRYGPMRREQVVSESKRTLPMQNVRQYEILQFKPNPTILAKRKLAEQEVEFIRSTEEAIDDDSERITFEQLREEVAQPSNV